MRVVVVMGVSGCGKSSLGGALAHHFDCRFLEGDAFHPAANVRKMSAGQALDDLDRWPWFDALCAAINTQGQAPDVVVSCSALKRNYRNYLREHIACDDVVFVWLDVPRAELERRMHKRQDHFMPVTLLDSQLQTLEPPEDEPRTIRLGVAALDAQLKTALFELSAFTRT